MENILIVKTHISDIKPGDTILAKGVPTTVCKKDIKYDSFMGTSIFGSSYPRIIDRVLFKVPTSKGIVLR